MYFSTGSPLVVATSRYGQVFIFSEAVIDLVNYLVDFFVVRPNVDVDWFRVPHVHRICVVVAIAHGFSVHAVKSIVKNCLNYSISVKIVLGEWIATTR